MDPENQLSTDDFGGHLAHNTNLSIKAIEALGAFVQIARGVGDTKLAERYEQVVRPMPARWQTMALEGDHYKLAFDQAGTWSQKYNLVWDQVLGLHLFSPQIVDQELAFYLKHQNAFGLPLDNRKTYTKLDWITWTATLTENGDDFAALIAPVLHFIDSTPDRSPLTDWYETKTARKVGFTGRPV